MSDMNWKKDLKERYAKHGWEALRIADTAFKKRIDQFRAERGLSVIDDNPEGSDWMVLLKNGEELYVDRRSYDTQEGGAFWIEYKPESGGITAEFFDANGHSKRHEVVVPESEILMVSNDWR